MTAFNGDGLTPDNSFLDIMARQAGINPKELSSMVEAIMHNLLNAKTVLQMSTCLQRPPTLSLQL